MPASSYSDPEKPYSNGSSKGAPPSTHNLLAACSQVNTRVDHFLSRTYADARSQQTQAQVKKSIGIIEEALTQYPLSSLSLSYNGGKDCLVLLLLFLNTLHNRKSLPSTLKSVYIVSAFPFPEIDSFVATSSVTYSLDVVQYALPMREAFEVYLREQPHVKAIFVGTRRTDPHGGNLRFFQKTDGGWPDFVRIMPVLDWHYAEIWTFIRALEVPYCPLYDRGFTSLGGTTDTHPNPKLRIKADSEATTYRPAYELVEDEEERLGRDR